MKKILYVLLVFLLATTAYAQETSNIDSHVVPITDNLDDFGSSSKGLKTIYTNNIVVDEVFLEGLTTKSTTDMRSGTNTLTAAESGYIIITATHACTFVLLSTASVTSGTRYRFINTVSTTTTKTIDGHLSETISGSTTNTAIDAQYDILDIMSVDGVGWLILETN